MIKNLTHLGIGTYSLHQQPAQTLVVRKGIHAKGGLYRDLGLIQSAETKAILTDTQGRELRAWLHVDAWLDVKTVLVQPKANQLGPCVS